MRVSPRGYYVCYDDGDFASKTEKSFEGKIGTREIFIMSALLTTCGRWGGILTLIALLIVLVKQLIALVGFLLFALKIAIVIAFVGMLLIIVLSMLRGRGRRRREAE